jgi:putative heme-binding domain-containing protein
MLLSIAQGSKLPVHTSWIGPLRESLESVDPQISSRAIAAINALDTEVFDQQLATISRDKGRPGTLRVTALAALENRNAPLSDAALVTLLDLISAGGPTESVQAAQMIGAARLSSAQLRSLAPQLSSAGPTALRDLIRPFGKTLQPEVADAFLSGLESARSFERLSVTEVSDVIKRFPADLLPRANVLLDRLKTLDQQRLETLDRLVPLVRDADPQRGRSVFFAEKSKCATCHRVGKNGGVIGPDLTTIGSNRSTNDLMESIVFPSASIVRQYETQTLLTADGEVFSGIITRETADAIELQQQTGTPVTIDQADVEGITPSVVSIMPNGLEMALTDQELADMVAWLTTLGNL